VTHQYRYTVHLEPAEAGYVVTYLRGSAGDGRWRHPGISREPRQRRPARSPRRSPAHSGSSDAADFSSSSMRDAPARMLGGGVEGRHREVSPYPPV